MSNFNAETFRKDLENIAHDYCAASSKLWLSYKIATNVALDSGDFRGIEALEAAAEAARKAGLKDFLTALRHGNNVMRALAYGVRAEGKAVKFRIAADRARQPLSQAISDIGADVWHKVRDGFKDLFAIKVTVTPAKRSVEDRLAELAAEAGRLIGGNKQALASFIASVKAEAAKVAAKAEEAKAEAAKASAADKLAEAKAAVKAA